jgi:hypothetical protein
MKAAIFAATDICIRPLASSVEDAMWGVSIAVSSVRRSRDASLGLYGSLWNTSSAAGRRRPTRWLYVPPKTGSAKGKAALMSGFLLPTGMIPVVETQTTLTTLPALRQRLHILMFWTLPLISALTSKTLGRQVRRVRFLEWETVFPKVVPLPQISHLLDMIVLQLDK